MSRFVGRVLITRLVMRLVELVQLVARALSWHGLVDRRTVVRACCLFAMWTQTLEYRVES